MSCEYEKILVAIDGSKGGEVALKEAIEVAKRNGAHLDVLRVMDLNSLEYGGARQASPDHLRRSPQASDQCSC